MKRLALHWQIIIGMILGVFFGILAYHFSLNNFTNDWDGRGFVLKIKN